METPIMDMIPLQNPNPAALFVPNGMDELLALIEREARSLDVDATTAKGRKAIAGQAAKVARSKTYLDNLGKEYVADLKATTKAVDQVRKAMRDRLDTLKAEVRQPLTDWEQAEADRQAAIRERIEAMRSEQENIHPGGTAEPVQAAIDRVNAVAIGEDFAEFADEAQQVKEATLYRLHQALEQIQEREEQQARELAERRARDEAERREREERIAREAAERARAEAEAQARAATERAERERIEAIRRKEEAERQAREAEQRRQEQAAQAEKQAREAAEQAARAERERIEAQRREEDAAEMRRIANREHQAKIHSEIVADLADCGISEDVATEVVRAVARGHVSGLRIQY